MKYEYFILDDRSFTTGDGEVLPALLNGRLNYAAEQGYRLVNVYRNQLIMERPVRYNPYAEHLKERNEDAL